MASSDNASTDDYVQLHLSRSSYPLNSSILGSVHLTSPSSLSSVQVYLSGRCRLDPRWHDVPSLLKLHGTHPFHHDVPSGVEELAISSYFNKSTTTRMPCLCFWSTNVVTLWNYEYSKEKDNEHEHHEPPSIQVPMQVMNDPNENQGLLMDNSEWLTTVNTFLDSIPDDSKGNGEEKEEKPEQNDDPDGRRPAVVIPPSSTCTEEQRNANDNPQTESSNLPMSFTFRADLSQDLPPSINATCARYFYSAVVVARTIDGKVSRQEGKFFF